MVAALGLIGAYVALVGIASFLEEPIARQLDPFRLGAALRFGALVVAVGALFADGRGRIPASAATPAGIGIGVVAGLASICYCQALAHMPAWRAASIANGYVAVTVALGIIFLGDTFDAIVAAGLLLTIVGVVALSWRPRSGKDDSAASSPVSGIVALVGYIVLAGVSAFLEKPALGQLAPLQLNALTAFGMAAAGFAAIGVGQRGFPTGAAALAATGIGLMIGLGAICYFLGLVHLPVSIAATLANTYVLVTTGLSVVVRHRRLDGRQIAGGIATIAGVCVLTLVHR